jgi:hypothetical protein
MITKIYKPLYNSQSDLQYSLNYTYNGEHKQVIWLHLTKEVEIFLSRLEAQDDGKNKSA